MSLGYKRFNNYKIDGDTTILYLRRKNDTPLECYIDTKNLEKLLKFGYSWYATWQKTAHSYYAKCTVYLGISNGKIQNKLIYLHKFLMNVEDDKVIDHINHNTLDNREINLRVTEVNKNLKHRSSKNSNNTSGYRNVSWNSKTNKWMVQLQINGRNTNLGDFDDVDEAGQFAKKMREKYYGEFAGKT